MEDNQAAKESLYKRGELKGHGGFVTGLRTLNNLDEDSNLLSSSRDKSMFIWNISKDGGDEGNQYTGSVKRALRGHNHFIQDLVVSSDKRYAISASWDATMRLWDIEAGQTVRSFIGHTKDVMSVDFSPDNRQIVSGGRDKTVRLWNTLAECKLTMEKNPAHTSDTHKQVPQMHSDWVSCVRFSPFSDNNPKLIVSAGWDSSVKLWNQQNLKMEHNLKRHNNLLNTVAISPDAYICASGGKDGIIDIWALNGKFLNEFDCGSSINALAFNPERYWLVAGTDAGIKVWDLQSKTILTQFQALENVDDLKQPSCLSLAWANDNNTLFAGYSDSTIRVYGVEED
eukprot:CAMPEP_0115006126 /NCGR_PEP_ID=MMETSP0216-20121206/20298_1 /TAXON_ID=223996 /ORGANISM="Protocruzia adherens, Strain Boccale" /LENGTH=340 /DNA_ID=CAMNT_0002372617 /DNA_START=55 /DNA_END=1077 /DNA_ORIENTATION=-